MPDALGGRVRAAGREILSCELGEASLATDAWPPAIGVRWRALFPLSDVEADGGLQRILRFRAAGVDVRLHRALPVSMHVFDRRTVALPADLDDPAPEEWVVHESPALGAALGRLFERWWQESEPVDTSYVLFGRRGPDAMDWQVADLLAAGHKDQAIARQLQVSVATVRRRIQRLNTHLDATTRFQAGMAYARRMRFEQGGRGA